MPFGKILPHNIVPSVLTVTSIFHKNTFKNSNLKYNRSPDFTWHVFGNPLYVTLKTAFNCFRKGQKGILTIKGEEASDDPAAEARKGKAYDSRNHQDDDPSRKA